MATNTRDDSLPAIIEELQAKQERGVFLKYECTSWCSSTCQICLNSVPLWQALQAFDIIHSGLVKQDVLRPVLSSFIYPMNPRSFHKLTSQQGKQYFIYLSFFCFLATYSASTSLPFTLKSYNLAIIHSL